MPLSPLPPRDDSPEEARRNAADRKDRKDNPANWGAANSQPQSAQASGQKFFYLPEYELAKLSRSVIDEYAQTMPNGFDPDENEMTKKEIIAAIMAKTPPKD